MSPATPLVAENLALCRGDRRLFSGFSLRVEAGEVVLLAGRNGAGKTTLLEALAGLRRPEQGHVRRTETDALHWLGHKNGLNPALSAVENLEFWCGLNGVPAVGVTTALHRLGVRAARHRPVRTLSTGQKRRTALARLLLVRRPWWLLDEPLAGLDAAGTEDFAALLDMHRRAGGGVLLTAHQALPASCGPVRVVALP
jgi:heme exporter protein A